VAKPLLRGCRALVAAAAVAALATVSGGSSRSEFTPFVLPQSHVSHQSLVVLSLAPAGDGAPVWRGRRHSHGHRGERRVQRRGAVTLHLARAAGWALLLALRFATGAPLGRRRTDATFLSRGTHPVGGVPGWFTTGQPGRWAYLPGWQRAAVRWTAVAAAIGLHARPLLTAVVLGGAALAAGAALAPRWRQARYVRAVIRPVYLQLCGYLGTDPDANPLPWLDIPRGHAATPDAVLTLTYPAAWNPDAAKQKNIDEVIRRHLGGGLAGTFGPHAPPGGTRPPRRPVPCSRAISCPRTASTWPPSPAGASGSLTWKTRNRTCSSRPAPAAERQPPRALLPRTPARTAG